MIVTDQLKIIDKKIKADQAQYLDRLDRLAAKISAYSSCDLRKYEYLTGEDFGYKPSVFEQAKCDYSLLGNIFTKGLDKDDQKEGLFKRLESVKGKNEELLNAFSAANKGSKAAKNESKYNYDNTFAFYDFYRGFKKFRRTSLGSKYDEINTHKATNNETKNGKERVMKKVAQLYNDYFDLYKEKYDSEKVKDEEKRGRD